MELFSPGHLIVLLVIVGVLFFGWKQLPDMARSAGRSMRIFRTEIKGMSEDVKATVADVHDAGQSTVAEIPIRVEVPIQTVPVAADSVIAPGAAVPVVVPAASDRSGLNGHGDVLR